MSGPPPKPRDQRVRRNRGEGTTSTSVELVAAPGIDWLEDWPGSTVEVEHAGEVMRIPAPPRGLLAQTRRRWTAYWVSAEAQMLRPHHVPALERLVRLYDEEERIRRRVARSKVIPRAVPMGLDGPAKPGEQVVEHDVRAERIPGHLGIGSQGQLVESPDFKALMRVRIEVRQLEDRFAGSPLAEFRVGWQHAAMLNEQGRAREAQAMAEAAQRIAAQHAALLEG